MLLLGENSMKFENDIISDSKIVISKYVKREDIYDLITNLRKAEKTWNYIADYLNKKTNNRFNFNADNISSGYKAEVPSYNKWERYILDAKNYSIIEKMLKKLYEFQIQSIIVEGGSLVLQQFIDADLWDEIIVIKNKNLILENGTKAPRFENTPLEVQDFRDNIIEFHKNFH